MKVLVKVGGTLLEDNHTRRCIAEQLRALREECQVTTVHGGGKQVTKYLENHDTASSFVGGLRVSDNAVIDAVVKVIAGTVNKQFVATLIAAGCPAVGLSGIDGALTKAAQLSPELGQVGDPQHSDGRLLNLLVEAGYLPVIACVAVGAAGEIFNVNADRMAVSCAAGWGADTLLFLTDVPGVKDAEGKLIPHLTRESAQELIRTGVAQGGMQAKLESANLALRNGVTDIIIASGRERDVCHRALRDAGVGTRLTRAVSA